MNRLIAYVSKILAREATARTLLGISIGLVIAIAAAVVMMEINMTLKEFAKTLSVVAIAMTLLTILALRKGKW